MTTDSTGTFEQAITEEAIRVYRRYGVDIVEALTLCPFAAPSRRGGHVVEYVSLVPELSSEAALTDALEIVHRAADDTTVEIGLVLFPLVDIARIDFARFVERLRRTHQDEPTGLVMAMESFHPDSEVDTSSAERLIPFLRRTPDPTIQLVRQSVLDRVRRGTEQGTAFFDITTMSLEALEAKPSKPLHTRIAETNHETVRAHGADAIAQRFADVRRDRDESYARLRAQFGR